MSVNRPQRRTQSKGRSLSDLSKSLSARYLHMCEPWHDHLALNIERPDVARFANLVAIAVFEHYLKGRLISKMELLDILGTQHNETGNKYLNIFVKAELFKIEASTDDARKMLIVPTQEFIDTMTYFSQQEPPSPISLLDYPDDILVNWTEHQHIIALALNTLHDTTRFLKHSPDAYAPLILHALSDLVLKELSEAAKTISHIERVHGDTRELIKIKNIYSKLENSEHLNPAWRYTDLMPKTRRRRKKGG